MCRAFSQNLHSYEVSRHDCDKVIESTFLQAVLANFSEALAVASEPELLAAPYMLDIDLDYFNTFASVAPQDAGVVQRLAKGAGLIAIATEPRHVKTCALDRGLTSDHLLNKLLALLAAC